MAEALVVVQVAEAHGDPRAHAAGEGQGQQTRQLQHAAAPQEAETLRGRSLHDLHAREVV